MGMLQEFREFSLRGNVVDMAVGIVIGAAFGKIATSFVSDVLMPPARHHARGRRLRGQGGRGARRRRRRPGRRGGTTASSSTRHRLHHRGPRRLPAREGHQHAAAPAGCGARAASGRRRPPRCCSPRSATRCARARSGARRALRARRRRPARPATVGRGRRSSPNGPRRSSTSGARVARAQQPAGAPDTCRRATTKATSRPLGNDPAHARVELDELERAPRTPGRQVLPRTDQVPAHSAA